LALLGRDDQLEFRSVDWGEADVRGAANCLVDPQAVIRPYSLVRECFAVWVYQTALFSVFPKKLTRLVSYFRVVRWNIIPRVFEDQQIIALAFFEGDDMICRRRPLWTQFIFALDRWLRHRHGVFEYAHKPNCILRVQLGQLHKQVMLSDGTVGFSGDRIIDLHLWNEKIPVAPVQGYSLAWGCRVSRCFMESLGELARFLMSEPELSDINIIRANINFDSLYRIAVQHGFESVADNSDRPSPWEHIHRFGENILCWLLMRAYNSASVRSNKFRRSQRPVYLSRRVLMQKYIRYATAV